MFTRTEKKYLALTIIFLASGSGLKAWRHAQVQLGPMEDPVFAALDAEAVSVAGPKPDSLPSRGPALGSADTPDSLAVEPDTGKTSLRPNAGLTNSQPSHTGVNRKPDFTGKVSVNQATAAELMAIPGIGAKTAQFILNYRKEHGPFGDLQDLLRIKGIGEKKLEKLGAFLIL